MMELMIWSAFRIFGSHHRPEGRAALCAGANFIGDVRPWPAHVRIRNCLWASARRRSPDPAMER